MAQLGRKSTAFIIKGTSRKDPLPTLLRKYVSLEQRQKELYLILKRAGEPMAADMRQGSPSGATGALAASFRARKAKKKKFGHVSVFVGGIKKGTITGAKGGIVKMAGWRAHWAELGTVNHQGAYFLQPAIRRGIPVAKKKIRKGMQNLVRRLRKKGVIPK